MAQPGEGSELQGGVRCHYLDSIGLPASPITGNNNGSLPPGRDVTELNRGG